MPLLGKVPGHCPATALGPGAFYWKRPPLEIGVAMQRELTPTEARSGVISGRIIRILIISTTVAVIALGVAWLVVI